MTLKYNEPAAFTISLPLEKANVTNLKKIIASKENLIKKALGAKRLTVDVKDDTISFPWFDEMPDPDAAPAITHFIAAICDMSIRLHIVTAGKRDVENEKYTFRCFLLRLGFIGNEYKAERHILLKNLNGSAAYREV